MTDYAKDEKQNGTAYVERHSSDEEGPIARNDRNDGHVQWTLKTVIATASLCGIWVGAQVPLYFVGGEFEFIIADVGSPGVASWITVSYTLAIGAIAPFCGYLADIFGQRNITLVGAVLVMVGIVIVGTAHSFGQACGGMTVTGFGAAITELNALAGISSIVPVNKRGFYLAICTAFLFPWTPYVLYSQLLGTRSTWRWGMWICLIYNGVFFTGLVTTFFPERVTRTQSTKDVLKKMDIIGGVLSVTGITLFLVALGSGGYTHTWTSAYTLSTLFIGLALIAAFVVWEMKGATVPIVPKELFQGDRVIAMAYTVAFVGGMNLYSVLNFFPIILEDVYGGSPTEIGVRGLGYGISVTAGATIINGLLSIFPKHNRELLVFSAILMTAFGGALAAVTPANPGLAVALGTISGFGIGGIYVPAATIALQASPDALLATAVALSLSVRTIGGSVGYTIYYNVYVERLKGFLPAEVGAAVLKAGLPVKDATAFVTTFATEGPSAVVGMPGATAKVIAAAVSAYQTAQTQSLSYVWYVSIAFGVCSIIAAACIGDVGKHMTNHIAGRIR